MALVGFDGVFEAGLGEFVAKATDGDGEGAVV